MTKNSSLSGPRLREEIELPPSDPGSRQGSRFWPSQHCHGRHPRQGGGCGRPASRLRLRARGHQDCRGRPKIHSSRTTINFLFHWRLCGLTQTLFSSFLKEANPNFLALRNSTETFCLARTRVRSFYGNEERFTPHVHRHRRSRRVQLIVKLICRDDPTTNMECLLSVHRPLDQVLIEAS